MNIIRHMLNIKKTNNLRGENTMTKFISVKSTNQTMYSINVDHIKLVSYRSDGQKNYLTEIHVGNYRVDTYDQTIQKQLEERA